MQLDLANFASIHEFANNVATKEGKVDFLICNAGIGWNSDKPEITCDGQVSYISQPNRYIYRILYFCKSSNRI
jgi:NAD(P)-dependent dehydrogenase (short-subunit alcohol dehydrogenase family)